MLTRPGGTVRANEKCNLLPLFLDHVKCLQTLIDAHRRYKPKDVDFVRLTIANGHGLLPFDKDFKVGSTSLVLCNTEKGERAASRLIETGRVRQADVALAIAGNVPLRHPVGRPRVRSISYRLLDTLGFARATRICCWKHTVKRLLKGKGV